MAEAFNALAEGGALYVYLYADGEERVGGSLLALDGDDAAARRARCQAIAPRLHDLARAAGGAVRTSIEHEIWEARVDSIGSRVLVVAWPSGHALNKVGQRLIRRLIPQAQRQPVQRLRRGEVAGDV